LPALSRAWKLQAKASTVGFDWNNARLVLDKIREETAEIDEALASGDKAAIKEEIGDLLFVVANLARHVDADPEGCLHAANAKFERRFKGIEQALEVEGRTAKDATLDEMEALWQMVKRAEKAGAASRTCSSTSASIAPLQRRAEGGDEMGRQVGDEADRVRQHDPRAMRQLHARAASGRAWQTACPRPARRPGQRLNSVDLPALV
jgi:NTP pyrophosphatase (non-canonical NTP hydrolase)